MVTSYCREWIHVPGMNSLPVFCIGRRSWETWNWAGAKQRARHKIGQSGGVSSAVCAPAGVERQRRRILHWRRELNDWPFTTATEAVFLYVLISHSDVQGWNQESKVTEILYFINCNYFIVSEVCNRENKTYKNKYKYICEIKIPV